MNVRPSSLGLDACDGSCSSPPAAWTPRPACDGRRRIRAWQGCLRPPRWPAPESAGSMEAEACDQPACARCGRGPWPTFYESPVVGCRRQDPSPRRHVAGAARRLRASQIRCHLRVQQSLLPGHPAGKPDQMSPTRAAVPVSTRCFSELRRSMPQDSLELNRKNR